MCLLVLAWQAHPDWRLIVAGNRDERHDRPAAGLTRWDAPDHVIAGRDLLSGGTWLGVSERGRFASVTNVRNPAGPAAGLASRGALVTEFLAGEGPYADPSRIDPAAFNPFNLLAIDGDRAVFVSNRPEPERRPLDPGVYGLANGRLDEPWPKTLEAKSRMADWIAAGGRHPEALLGMLALEAPAGLEAGAAPSDDPLNPSLTPIFIRNPDYGTRCSTVVAVDMAGSGVIVERTFTPAGAPAAERTTSFSWPT